jgi:hypothetical protein
MNKKGLPKLKMSVRFRTMSKLGTCNATRAVSRLQVRYLVYQEQLHIDSADSLDNDTMKIQCACIDVSVCPICPGVP